MRTRMLLLTLVCLALALTGCARGDFNRVADAMKIDAALRDAGLQVCSVSDLPWQDVPGFVEGRFYVVDTICTDRDPNRPGDLLSWARFDSVEARDAALRNFETAHRRQLGLGGVWTFGPYLLLSDGPQETEPARLLEQAMLGLTGE